LIYWEHAMESQVGRNLWKGLFVLFGSSTFEEYINCCEQLSDQTHNWSKVGLVETFIEGLPPEIRREVKVRRPRTMIVAISLARREEKRFDEEHCQIIKVAGKLIGKGSSSFILGGKLVIAKLLPCMRSQS